MIFGRLFFSQAVLVFSELSFLYTLTVLQVSVKYSIRKIDSLLFFEKAGPHAFNEKGENNYLSSEDGKRPENCCAIEWHGTGT